jgi:hypothetical protein
VRLTIALIYNLLSYFFDQKSPLQTSSCAMAQAFSVVGDVSSTVGGSKLLSNHDHPMTTTSSDSQVIFRMRQDCLILAND